MIDTPKLKMPPVWCGLKIEMEKHRDGIGQVYEEILAMREADTGAFVSGDRRIVCSVAHTAWTAEERRLEEICYVDVKQINPSAPDELFEEMEEARQNADDWLAAIEDKV